MKKIIAVVMIAALMLSLTGCLGMPQQSEATEAPTDAPALKTYEKSFKGLQQYLIDRGLIPKKSTEDQADTLFYDLLGADYGERYILNGDAFIELYDFTNAKNDTAKSVLKDIKDDGKFQVIKDFDDLDAVISKSGKYVAVYNSRKSYDYDAITKELQNW